MSHHAAIDEAPPPECELFKITIPVNQRETALANLDLMNINLFSLFGSEDSLVRTVARRECLFNGWDY